MTKECPRCLQKFECRNDNVMECDCISVILTSQDYEYISDNYTDCICTKCMKQIHIENTLKTA